MFQFRFIINLFILDYLSVVKESYYKYDKIFWKMLPPET